MAAQLITSSSRQRQLLLPILAILLALVLTRAASAAAPDDDAGGSHAAGGGGDEAAGRYPLMARLAPCLPLPVHSNCSQVPETLESNLLTCTHVSFQAGGYGQRARRAELAFEVEAEAEEGAGGEGGAGLTMVLLVGSTLWFEDQAAMYDFMQPKLAATLAASHGYDPNLQGPCMGGRQEGEGGIQQAAFAAVWRRRAARRRLLRGPEQQQEAGAEAIAAAGAEGAVKGANEDADGGIVPVPAAVATFAASGAAGVLGAGLPSCADVVAAFNAADGPGGVASPFAFLYTCNVTTSTPRAPPQPDDGSAGPAPQLLSYDELRPDDYPFTYFVFINANVESQPSQEQQPLLDDAPPSRAMNQTVRYAATFSPSYTPTQARLPQPAFALLVLLCVVCFVAMSAWVSAPMLDFMDRRGWLRARA